MKVNEPKEISPLRPVKADAASPQAEKHDVVTLENTREVDAAISQAKTSSGASRAAHLVAIEAAVRNGTFKPSASQVAQRILEAAELDARIQAMLPP
ncbi:MAG: flagellar biosynthesis anti-sigma factor FlgM [Myxococcaceae bacterium]|nr:flagellar biosynthesis anti-sigma factor FlgM [Myxococcaceae bacterium]